MGEEGAEDRRWFEESARGLTLSHPNPGASYHERIVGARENITLSKESLEPSFELRL